MTRNSILVQAVALIAGALLALSCGHESSTGPTVVASIVVTPGGDTLATLGRTKQFTGAAQDASGHPISSAALVWHSTVPAVASVDSATGLVTAVGSGLAIVRATSGGVTGEAIIEVSQAVAAVTVTPGSTTFGATGDTIHFAATAKDSGGSPVTGVRFVWSSSAPAVATVDTLGLATAQGPGTAAIGATGRGIPGYGRVSVTLVSVQLVITVPPVDLVAGSAINPAVQVEIRDSAGRVITGANDQVTVYVSAGPSGGQVVGTTMVNAVAGVATFSGLTIRKAGAGYAMSATTGALTSAASPAFAVDAGAAAQVVFLRSPPSTLEANVILDTVLVGLRDSFGNTIDTGAVNIALGTSPWPGVTIAGSNGQNLVSGVAKFGDLSVPRPGRGYTLVGTAIGGPKVSSDPFNVTVTTTSVSAGGFHACAIAVGGTFCWGSNSSLESGAPATGLDSVPHPVPGSLVFTQVWAGASATCGLVAGGQAYCWGSHLTGELGDSDRTGTNTPSPVAVAGNHLFRTLAAGSGFFCGLLADSSAYCWGLNESGQLGDGSTTERHYPVLVAGGLAFKQIAPGGHHTCGLTGAGAGYCWGANESGELGDSTTSPHPTPAPVLGGFTFKMLASGGSHSCGLQAAGVLCWGSNGAGQFGNGNFVSEPAPRLYTGTPFLVDTIVSAGRHSCATGNEAAACWGDDQFGELGDLGTSTPTPPFADFVAGGYLLTLLSANPEGSFTCGRRFDNGKIVCWGSNQYGQLGDGTTIERHSPVAVTQ